ncbi:MAG: peptidase M48 [Porticoccaceae bacterium]|nr:peptidase M48 [Porticoccaceae bacterium]
MTAKSTGPMRLICILAFTLGSLLAPFSMSMSESKEAAIGKEIYDKILAEMPIYNDDKLVTYVRRVGAKLASHSDEPDRNFTFTVIDSPDINAFATPGGYIYINRGLIGYLRSEAELAAVLAHEIAHVTANHSARQQRAQTTSNVAAGLLAILTGSGEVGEATALWGAATVRGYGRDMELEADAIGAKTMTRAGYNSSAIIDVLSLLKDHERFEKRRARESGREPKTYHGLFATHPRNDQRLAEIIDTTSKSGERGTIPFRIATDGLIWGRNFSVPEKKPNRYYDDNRAFRFDYPQGWQTKSTGTGVSVTAPEGAVLTLDIRQRTVQPPDQFIKNQLGIPFLRKNQGFVQHGMPAHTGLIPTEGSPDQRLAVIYYERGAYVFQGQAPKNARGHDLDDTFLAIIRSFAPVAQRLSGMEPQRIHYVKATARTTFAALARHLRLGKYGEEELRLINGYYPRGEPAEGDWIKIIR